MRKYSPFLVFCANRFICSWKSALFFILFRISENIAENNCLCTLICGIILSYTFRKKRKSLKINFQAQVLFSLLFFGILFTQSRKASDRREDAFSCRENGRNYGYSPYGYFDNEKKTPMRRKSYAGAAVGYGLQAAVHGLRTWIYGSEKQDRKEYKVRWTRGR